jgi:hypothetical protein
MTHDGDRGMQNCEILLQETTHESAAGLAELRRWGPHET